MTISARNWAWDAVRIADHGEWRELMPGEKLTLLCIAEHENAEYGFSFPSQDTIAKKTGQGERTVRRHIRSFVAAQVFTVEKRRRRDGVWAHSVYVLNVPASYRRNDPEWLRNQDEEPPATVAFGPFGSAA